MFDGDAGDPPKVQLTLYTDAFIIRGSLVTRQRRVTDMLNNAEDKFLVLGEVTSDEYGSRGDTIRAEYAQINLASVLFAVADTVVETPPELRTPKVTEEALISVPPFKVTGHIHVMPERDLREALTELTGKFLPVTDAAYWSDKVGEARQTAALVAVNHERAQILAPHQFVDPWADVGRPAAESATSGGDVPTATSEVPWPATDVPPKEPTGW
ncbi:MAG: hypothetical protein QOD78_1698 [Chloroflexota bacterium]|jgi:hypothetical protein|nr:hypothetical protein [Chloroflexota bacterium]